MRISIASRVTAACTALLVLSLLLVLLGLKVSQQVQVANARVDHLAHLLRTQDREDSAQRRLRLALGEATRDAERLQPVSDQRWHLLVADLRAFAALSAAPGEVGAPDMPAQVQRALARTRAAALDFVPIGQQLIDVARRDPAKIKAEMSGFLDALKRLEAERTGTREALGEAIEAGVDANIAVTTQNAMRILTGALIAILILFVSAVWLHIQVIAPIVAIAAQVRRLDAETPDPSAMPGVGRTDELGDLARGLSEYRNVVEQRRVAQQEIDYLAHHDTLTGLPNRLQFESRLAHELARSHRSGDQVAVFAIDMDEFKDINDRHGHAGGDAVLRRAATLLSECIRADDLVARIGGDEFAIIQAAPSQPAGAEALLTRLAAALALTADVEIPIRMSIGVAVSRPDQHADDLYNSADVALYRAKSDGRNTARFYDTGLQEEIRVRRRLGRDLESAVDAGQLYVVFQPIATTAMRIVGYEALLRWRHPKLGEITPSQFIPIAEATGQIDRVGMWMADRAIAAAVLWDPAITLSLNLSPIQFRDPALGTRLLELAERHGVPPTRLEFEVTESATLLGRHREAVLETLRMLQDAGAAIAMDDFGTGHSSLSNLKDFRFDKLKIDRSFIAAMLVDNSSASIIRATIGLGRSLGAVVVAEGVEIREQLDQLRGWGCDRVQGYLIGRPSETVTDGLAPEREQPRQLGTV